MSAAKNGVWPEQERSYPHGLYDQPLILKLEKHDRLSEAEKRALENAIARIRVVEADEDLVREGDRPEKLAPLLDGYAARYKIVSNGRRQISAIHVAGDFIDLCSFLLKTMDHGVLALTNCRIANVPHATLEKITEVSPSHTVAVAQHARRRHSPGMADDHGTPLRHGSHGAPDLRAVCG